MPTQSEAYPLSIKEALLLGIPVLATDVGGMSEILTDGIDGLLMKYDKKDIEEKMKFLLNNSILFSQLKSGAAQAKNKFEIEAVYQKIEKLLTN